MYSIKRTVSTAAVLAALLFVLLVVSITLGAADISIGDTFSILLSRIFPSLLGEGIRESHIHIIMNLRLPRILTAMVVGIALSVSGTVFQAVFRNPMADPFILGISSGSALGVAIGMVTGLAGVISARWGIPLSAFLGGLLATMVIYMLSGKGASSNTLLLAGIAMNFMLSSAMSLLMYFNRESVESIVYWNMGSLSAVGWNDLSVIIPLIALGVFAILLFSRELNAMTLGDETALSLGVSIQHVRIIVLLLSTVVTSAAVAISGTIGFVGLIIPHIMRMITGANHRTLLPYAALGGAIFLVISDALSRSIMPPTEIPVGIITAMAGAPYFIYLLKARGRNVL